MALPEDRYYVHDLGPLLEPRWLGDCEVIERWEVRDRIGHLSLYFTKRSEARRECMRLNVNWIADVLRLAKKVGNDDTDRALFGAKEGR
jgi:hypothetical protein